MGFNDMGLDPKGTIAIFKGACLGGKTSGTILFRPFDERRPFLVVHGYDARTGTWSEAQEFASLVGAWEAANPNILGLFPVFEGDIVDAVERAGLEPNADDVSKVVSDGFDECVWDAIKNALDARVHGMLGGDDDGRHC